MPEPLFADGSIRQCARVLYRSRYGETVSNGRQDHEPVRS